MLCSTEGRHFQRLHSAEWREVDSGFVPHATPSFIGAHEVHSKSATTWQPPWQGGPWLLLLLLL